MAPALSALPFRARLPATKSRWSCDLWRTLDTNVLQKKAMEQEKFRCLLRAEKSNFRAKSLRRVNTKRVVRAVSRTEFATASSRRRNGLVERRAQCTRFEHGDASSGRSVR